MHAAFLSPRPGSLPINANLKLSDIDRLAVLDDPAEWRLFSQPHDDESSAAAGLWESQVMVQGMHCAACALALERALLGLPGVVATQVSSASGRASVVWSAALKSKLANFKIPKKCFVALELPRNTMGKVQKNLLRDQYKSLFA